MDDGEHSIFYLVFFVSYLVVDPIISPFLYTAHLNCCFLGIEHISFPDETSLNIKYFEDPPTYKSPGINIPKNTPESVLIKISDTVDIHDFA